MTTNTHATVDAQGCVQSLSADPDGVYVPDGCVVIALVESVTNWPASPSPAHVLHCDSEGVLSWLDPRSLTDLKADKWGQIKARRDAAIRAGFTWDGSTFDSDATSQVNIQGAAQLATMALSAAQPFSIDWTLADNSVRTLAGADMLAVGQAMGQHIGAQHAQGRELRAAIEAAATAEDVEAVAWP